MRTVLIAEDDAAVREVSRMSLARLGCRVLTAADGEEALALAHAHAPDVVLSDVMMPRCTGLELLAALQADERLARIPVILMSAAVDVDARQAFAFLPKPFRLGDLEAVVGSALASLTSEEPRAAA